MDNPQKYLEAILAGCTEGIVLSDADNKIISVNTAFTAIMGYEASEIQGQPGSFLRSGRHDESFYTALWSTVKSGSRWSGETWVRRKSGEVFPEWLSIQAIKNAAGDITHYVAIFSDITERMVSAERIHFLTHFDPLTGLPNRTGLVSQLATILAEASEDGKNPVFYYINPDNFSSVNALAGVTAGDAVLQGIAERLRQLFPPEYFLSRLTGDRFMVVTDGAEDTLNAAFVAREILHAIHEPFIAGKEIISLTATVGISIYPADGRSADILIQAAETAMLIGSEKGRNQYFFHSTDMNEIAGQNLVLTNRMRQALQNHAFSLNFQPVVSLTDGTIRSAEALIRWETPEGSVSPQAFIPLAESTDLVIPITEWVIQQACEDSQAWLRAGLPVMPVSVNIPPRFFSEKNFKKRILEILRKTGLPSHLLKLEITEGAAMQDVEHTVPLLQDLRKKGLAILIDDFGTGYSSLSYLRKFPLDFLKIDQSFVRDIETSPESRMIIRTIIGLSKNLGLKIIAEGVETEQQLLFLLACECDFIQGYFFSAPVSAGKMAEFIAEQPFRRVMERILPRKKATK